MIAELDPNYPLSSLFNKDTWDSGLPVPSASFPALVRVTDPCCQQEQHKCSLIRFCSQPLLGLLQFCSLKQAKTAEIAKICFYHEDMSLPRVPLLPRAEHSEPQHITKGKRTGHCCCMWWWKRSREPRSWGWCLVFKQPEQSAMQSTADAAFPLPVPTRDCSNSYLIQLIRYTSLAASRRTAWNGLGYAVLNALHRRRIILFFFK